MKISIIVSILNSHEVVRRQIRHFEKMGLPDNVEIIYVDDGSDPPLNKIKHSIKNLHFYFSGDPRPWAVAIARNLGARKAKGEYLLMTDIDYIITLKTIKSALKFEGDKMKFRRRFGILDEAGDLKFDRETLLDYGLQEFRYNRAGNHVPPHPNNFMIKKKIFWELGGYSEERMHMEYPLCTSDGHFKGKWSKALLEGKYTDGVYRPVLYMFPHGKYCGDVDADPKGLFHKLTRKTNANYWYRRQKNESMPD